MISVRNATEVTFLIPSNVIHAMRGVHSAKALKLPTVLHVHSFQMNKTNVSYAQKLLDCTLIRMVLVLVNVGMDYYTHLMNNAILVS